MSWPDPDISFLISRPIRAGAIIGLEREFRSTPAGSLPHFLASPSFALLMLIAVDQVRRLTAMLIDNIQNRLRGAGVRMRRVGRNCRLVASAVFAAALGRRQKLPVQDVPNRLITQ